MSGKKQKKQVFEPGTGHTKFNLDEGDMYDHTSMFFDGQGGEEVAEMGPRNLKAEVELDELVYGGKKVAREQLEEDEQVVAAEESDEGEGEEGESEMEEEGEEEVDEEKSSESNLGQLQELKDSDEDLDFALEKLQDYTSTSKVVQQKQSQASDAEKSNAIRIQQKIGNELLHQRILMQKLLTHSFKFPKAPALNTFMKRDKDVKESVHIARRKVKEHIKGLQSLQKSLISLSDQLSTDSWQDVFNTDDDSVDVGTVQQGLEKNFEQVMLPWVEETVERWNARTQLYKNINQEQGKGKQTQKSILENVKEAVGTQQNMDKLVKKSQMKPGVQKSLGDAPNSVTQEYDVEIFNDHDFYQSLLKDFLESNDVSTANGADSHDNANLGLTQKFLEKRRRMKEVVSEEQKKKLVERKASKNRQIRYIVHEKIVNFMPKVAEGEGVREADHILESLFGRSSASAKRRRIDEDMGDVKLI